MEQDDADTSVGEIVEKGTQTELKKHVIVTDKEKEKGNLNFPSLKTFLIKLFNFFCGY